ncbi:MAG: hypothetical protein ACRDLR_09870, partial [Gaiellaceae bacterium]
MIPQARADRCARTEFCDIAPVSGRAERSTAGYRLREKETRQSRARLMKSRAASPLSTEPSSKEIVRLD